MKVETKKSAIVGTGICLLIFLFTFFVSDFWAQRRKYKHMATGE